MNWEGRKVLVTGAGGFIGSHLVGMLAQRGAKVRGLVRYNSRGGFGWLHDLPPDVYRSLEVRQGDLRDADVMLRAVDGCEVVFQFFKGYIRCTEIAHSGKHLNEQACEMYKLRAVV